MKAETRRMLGVITAALLDAAVQHAKPTPLARPDALECRQRPDGVWEAVL